jgi:antirestriction protein ArdC
MLKTASRPKPARKEFDPPDWSQILIDAVNKPGVISTAYQAFWNYSTGNQFLALFECFSRSIEPGPIHTFRGWLNHNRHVRKGEKAITLCMPVSWIEKVDPKKYLEPGENPTDHQQVVIRRRFIYRPNWFVLSQTEGDEYVPLAIPTWEEHRACHVLMIDREPFQRIDGNVQGYANQRSYAVSPIAYGPHRTLFHEIAHIILGHTAEFMGMTDTDERTPKDIREVEAEAVALICCQSLGLPGEEFSRGYLQHWLGSQKIEDRSAQRIFHAADQILKAGRPQVKPTDAVEE